jgi:glycine/D-amino acid oxidase-like deaminating enzyme
VRRYAQAVVIGGGLVGCSILYHLAKLGWTDVILLERDELTSGSTWHAAANIHGLHDSTNFSPAHFIWRRPKNANISCVCKPQRPYIST